MRTLTVRLPESLVAELEAESIERSVSKSDIVRERLASARRRGHKDRRRAPPAAIADLVGSVDGLPDDLSTRRKDYLCETGYGRRRPR